MSQWLQLCLSARIGAFLATQIRNTVDHYVTCLI